MRRRRSPAYVLSLGMFAVLVAGRTQEPLAVADAAPERWIVLFAQRDFDLEPYRSAIRAQRPADEVAAIVADLDRRAVDSQAPFTSAVERLGGSVLQHWWLIDGCAVEVPAGRGTDLLSLPNVLRIERDAMPRPGSEPTGEGRHGGKGPAGAGCDAWNHGVEAARDHGFTGKGVGLAILDTGQDADCGNSGRPHRIYYQEAADAPPGPGLAGSRLVQNLRLGSMPSDDRIGHGTAVAAIAAGAPWNGPGAAAGHAPEALIAGYAIAERQDGASSDTTIIGAWQQVARDRATFHLVGANNSYCGSPDPTTAVQQALDSAAHNADLLVTVCAYNTGHGGTAWSQSACNGLAVGAVTADEHVACSYSARGPLLGDAGRTYPDLCAVSSPIGPNPDCERSAGPWFGTSFAAPQVLGAAALVRQAAPQASALETKAILLAATLDIDAENGTAGRNATGTGLLRDDFAVATAIDPARHDTVTIGPTGRGRFEFAVTAGEPCAVAVAWHRTEFTTADWADFDLRILQDGRLLATASSPRNLYEHVRFVADRTGVCIAEVAADAPLAHPVEVAFAAAALPPSPAIASYRTAGRPCASSAVRAGSIVQDRNGTATADDLLRDVLQLSATEWLFEFEAPAAGVEVRGFEALLGLCDGPARLTTALYLADERGGPRALPASSSSTWIGRQPGWVATLFPFAVEVLPHQRYYLALQAPGTARFTLALRQGEPVHAFYRWPCSGEFVDGGRAAAGFRVLGDGEARGLDPLLANADVPLLGRELHLQVTQMADLAPIVLTTEAAATVARPIDLDLLGAPGCTAYVGAHHLVGAAADTDGTAEFTVGLPTDPGCCGMTFRQQAFALDFAANALGLAATPAGHGRIGAAD